MNQPTLDTYLETKAGQAHRYAIDRGAQCHLCPLGTELYQGPVPSTIRRNAKLTILAESPGSRECEVGENLVGASGKVLEESLDLGGLSIKECSKINTLLCRPPENEFLELERKLKLKHKKAVEAFEAGTGLDPGQLRLPTECCHPRLERDLRESNSNYYLAVGAQALKALAHHLGLPFGKKSKAKKKDPTQADLPIVKAISQQRGHPITTPDGKILVASYHPAFAMRQGSRQWMPVVRSDIARAARIAVRGYVDWNAPKGIIDPDIRTVEEICDLFVEHNAEVTVDIETDGKDPRKCRLRCVGMGAEVDGREIIIVIPFRHKNGEPWWEEREEFLAKKAVRQVLNNCRWGGHNAVSYDSSVLIRLGFFDNKRQPIWDSMIMDKNTDSCDLPHRLESVASRWFELPSWKISHDDDKYEDEANLDDDLEYHQYNCTDVGSTLRLHKKLRERLAQCGTTNQNEIDERLAPIYRDMGNLGICYDLRRRMNIARILDVEITRREVEVKRIIKESTGSDEFNVRSNQQIGQFLYGHKGLIPPLNTKGDEWQEGETASAASAALLKILAKGVDNETRNFINGVLRFRAYEKQAGTYSGRIAKEDDPKTGVRRGELYDGLPIDWDDYTSIGYGVLPVLHYNYRLIIASGRVSANPGIQVIPEVSRISICYECSGAGEWEGSVCKICKGEKCKRCGGDNEECPFCYGDGRTRAAMNLRAMFRAAPGHVLVGADFDALELRGMAYLAKDKAFLKILRESRNGKPYDVHLYNYACLASKSESEILKLYDAMMAKGGKDNKEVKVLRGYAKVFCFACIAEDTPVLTDRGEVPIQDVLPTDKVWDGVEWVSHNGVIFKGEQEVIEYDGLVATPDHKVWLQNGGTSTFGEAAWEDANLQRSGPLEHGSSTRHVQFQVLGRRNVYDILNAGPRRRFTAAGRLVSNCFYGASPDKIFEYMSTLRGKATGELEFPELSRDPGKGFQQCQTWHSNFFLHHSELRTWQREALRNATRNGYSASPRHGRKRFSPGGLNSPQMPLNHPNQGLGADLTNESMLEVDEKIPFECWSPLTGLNLQVHDFLGGQYPENKVAEAKAVFKEAMEYDLGSVLITATPCAGTYWSEL